ncbi:MAG: hypothetical protein ACTHKG_21365 [Nocardioides sp.]
MTIAATTPRAVWCLRMVNLPVNGSPSGRSPGTVTPAEDRHFLQVH